MNTVISNLCILVLLGSAVRLLEDYAKPACAAVTAGDKLECQLPLVPLFACLVFLQGKEGKVPSSDCCKAARQTLPTKLRCLCGVLKDGFQAYLPDERRVNVTYNTTAAYYVPSSCHLPSNLSKCIDLLKLEKNSTDAQKFNQAAYDNARLLARASAPTPSQQPSGSPKPPMVVGLTKCDGYWACNKRKFMALIEGLASALALLAFVLILVGLIMCKRHRFKKRAKAVRREREEILSAKSGGRSVKLFSGKDMRKATNSFSDDLLIGSGGFGNVYKGSLEDGTPIAVKIGKAGSIHSRDSVLNEVSILAQVNHRTLVHLLGCCVELDQPMLVYEFISNGTLHDHIHTSKYGFLSWHQRLKIAHQAAQGLAYLHFSAIPPIYHRDVKSSNILLDEKCNAKVSDFGMSRLVHPDRTHVSTCVVGTIGYLDPEYYKTYKLTEKSDVYSFGVVLLELLSSERVIDSRRDNGFVNLVQHARHGVEEGRVLDIVDKDLSLGASQWSVEAMGLLCSVAMQCVEEKGCDRPSMKDVVEEIELAVSIIQAYTGSGTNKRGTTL